MVKLEEAIKMINSAYFIETHHVERTNVECDLCGKDLSFSDSVYVKLCPTEKDLEDFQDDPLSFDVLIFGTTCFKKVEDIVKAREPVFGKWFGAKVKAKRKKMKMSQWDLAHRLNCSQSLTSKIERGKIMINFDLGIKVIDVLDLDYKEISNACLKENSNE